VVIFRGHVSARVPCRREIDLEAVQLRVDDAQPSAFKVRSQPAGVFVNDAWRIAGGLRRSSSRRWRSELNEFP
jgi:hypothetical protein